MVPGCKIPHHFALLVSLPGNKFRKWWKKTVSNLGSKLIFSIDGMKSLITSQSKPSNIVPGQVLKRREDGNNLCEKFSKLSKVIFIAGPWIEQIDKEKNPEERRKWLLLDYNNIDLIFHLPHEDAKQALEKVEELYTIHSFNLHKFKINY